MTDAELSSLKNKVSATGNVYWRDYQGHYHRVRSIEISVDNQTYIFCGGDKYNVHHALVPAYTSPLSFVEIKQVVL